MNSLPAIEIIFYDDDDAVIATHRRNRIPAYVLDMAIDLGAKLENLGSDDGTPAADQTAPLFDFIVELFGNKFTREELKQHADLMDCMSVFRSVLARGNMLATQMAQANPTMPPSRKTK